MSLLTPSFPNAEWDGTTGNKWRTTRHQDVDPSHEDWDRISAEMIAVQNHLLNPVAAEETGSVDEAVTGVTAAHAVPELHRTVLTLENVEVPWVDTGITGGYGHLKLFNFPAGTLEFLGGALNLTLQAGDGGIADNAALEIGVGSSPTNNVGGNLPDACYNAVGRELTNLVGGEKTISGTRFDDETHRVPMDGATPVALWLNFTSENAGSSGNDTLTVNGTITVTWINYGTAS